ncbi:hypothetical protein EVAR_89585_1 [Eumeta japonica]|uniref:Uncharacterized protein n=1 Tax=Eumeta variegata TaxID=151549 RepID=A0A4C1XQU3_EUMVA|nr:hypothetical protein EVAR_89585_1 [Eumeta japonica]
MHWTRVGTDPANFDLKEVSSGQAASHRRLRPAPTSPWRVNFRRLVRGGAVPTYSNYRFVHCRRQDVVADPLTRAGAIADKYGPMHKALEHCEHLTALPVYDMVLPRAIPVDY